MRTGQPLRGETGQPLRKKISAETIRSGTGMCRVLTVAAILLALAGCTQKSAPGSASSKPLVPAENRQAFLAQHWQRPLHRQGQAPRNFNQLETSLAPAACGTCHPQQFEDWKTALHSKAMSPGLFGQLREMGPDAVDEHQSCLQCHAPLAEQEEQLRQSLADGARTTPQRPDGVSYAHGLTCAGCHVRNRQVYGPPRKDGSTPASVRNLPHNGWQATNAFRDSRFCAACHQFEKDGPTLNGKLLENTYEEWRASRYAREGRSCQSCHMPERRHLWRGIHDPEMVRSGLGIKASQPTVANGNVAIEVLIANTGVGHAFPTYVTPRVMVEIGQETRRKRTIPASVERHLISRTVALDLRTETADTRIMPDETRHYGYNRKLRQGAVALSVRIVVQPDAFYADFYRATLAEPEFLHGRKAIKEALQRAQLAPYTVFYTRQPIALPPSPRK